MCVHARACVHACARVCVCVCVRVSVHEIRVREGPTVAALVGESHVHRYKITRCKFYIKMAEVPRASNVPALHTHRAQRRLAKESERALPWPS